MNHGSFTRLDSFTVETAGLSHSRHPSPTQKRFSDNTYDAKTESTEVYNSQNEMDKIVEMAQKTNSETKVQSMQYRDVRVFRYLQSSARELYFVACLGLD
jgi:monoamine oxidase